MLGGRMARAGRTGCGSRKLTDRTRPGEDARRNWEPCSALRETGRFGSAGSAGRGQVREDDDVAGVARSAAEQAAAGEHPELGAPTGAVHLLVGEAGLVEDPDAVDRVDGDAAVGAPGLDAVAGAHVREGGEDGRSRPGVAVPDGDGRAGLAR